METKEKRNKKETQSKNEEGTRKNKYGIGGKRKENEKKRNIKEHKGKKEGRNKKEQ